MLRLSSICLGGWLLLVSTSAQAAIWPSAVRRAERELGSSDAAARQAAVVSLAELPRASARRLLLRALEDADSQVASSALELLLRLETPDVTERVVPWLSGTDKRLRLSAALALGVAPAPSATAALGRALGDSDAEVRAAAATALGASQSAEAVLPLLGHLDDSVPEVREAVATALGSLGDARAVLPLIGKVEDPRPNVRAAVARALGSLRDGRSVSALLLALRDNDRAVVVAVVRALGALGEGAAVAPFANMLAASPDAEVRRAVIGSLGRIGSVEAGNALIRELSPDEAGREREPVLAALAATPGAYVSLLRQCLDTSLDASQSEGCALALAEAGDQSSAARVRMALDRGRLSAKVGLSVLGKLGDTGSLSAALERLSAPDAETRLAAMTAAAALLSPRDADGRAVEPLARALLARGASRGERLKLVELLGRTGSERALSTLLPLLVEATDPAVSESAAAALGNVPGKASASALLEALGHDEPRVKRAAALAIRRREAPELLAALVSRYEQGGRSDRALMALALFGSVAKSDDDAALARVGRLLRGARGSERETLIEALARSPRRVAKAELARLASSADVHDRAKWAEVASAAPDPLTLLRLLSDVDARVRANAAWSLGFATGTPRVRASLARALTDREASVSGNAAVALGRLSRGQPELARAVLCGAPLKDVRASVREQALRGLQLAGASCGDGAALKSLARDPRARVRRAAAELLLRASTGPLEQRALSRCQESDPHAVVAETCGGPARAEPREREPVTLLIVPSSGGEPTPFAPFALLLADGSLRLGVADRRGAVHEPQAPSGGFELLPYAGGD